MAGTVPSFSALIYIFNSVKIPHGRPSAKMALTLPLRQCVSCKKEQLETMLLIIRLKSYNFSLEEIKRIIESGEPGEEKLYSALIQKKEEMKKQLHEQEKSLYQMECDICQS